MIIYLVRVVLSGLQPLFQSQQTITLFLAGPHFFVCIFAGPCVARFGGKDFRCAAEGADGWDAGEDDPDEVWTIHHLHCHRSGSETRI